MMMMMIFPYGHCDVFPNIVLKHEGSVRYEVFTAILKNIAISWNVTPCWLSVNCHLAQCSFPEHCTLQSITALSCFPF